MSTSRAPGGQCVEHLGGTRLPGVQAHRGGGEQPGGAHGQQVGRARPGADEVHGHRVTAHCVTVRAGRQPLNPPNGSRCSTPIRTSSPPRSERWRSSTASDSAVTACTTSRPPGASASQQASSRPVDGRAATDEHGVRRGRARPAPRVRAPTTTCRPGTPSREALRPAGVPRARCPVRPRRRGRSGGAASTRCPRCPAPAPTSQSSWPGAGASRDSALARRSRLVSCPSCSNASSGSPGVVGCTRSPRLGPALDRQRPPSCLTARGGRRPCRCSHGLLGAAEVGQQASGCSGRSRCGATAPPQRRGRPARAAARAADARAGARRRRRLPGPVSRLTVLTSWAGQPEPGARQGQRRRRRVGPDGVRTEPAAPGCWPTPCQEGSPLASTTRPRPRCRSTRSTSPGSSGRGRGTALGVQVRSGSSASWRSLPSTTSGGRAARRARHRRARPARRADADHLDDLTHERRRYR